MTKEQIEKTKLKVKENFDYFQSQLPTIAAAKRGKFALLHEKQIQDFYDSDYEAIESGIEKYGWGNFSVQEVGASRIELGYQSYALF